MEPMKDLMARYELTRGNLCPGTLLALRVAVLGCTRLGIGDPRGADRKKLIVWIEIDRWLADAVEVVTGARLGKRTLKFLDYGKLAATFLARRSASLRLNRRVIWPTCVIRRLKVSSTGKCEPISKPPKKNYSA
jgi:formylmethanofuran dehydrogenase subunit E